MAKLYRRYYVYILSKCELVVLIGMYRKEKVWKM